MTNLAVVGVGYWGPNLVRNALKLQNAKLAAICDIDEAQLEKMQHPPHSLPPGVHRHSHISQVLSNQKIDAVILATPIPTHYELAKQSLEAGKHVFVEKPLAMKAEEAEELVRLAESKKLVLFTGHTFLYHPGIRKLKELITSGELGEILHIHSERLNLGRLKQETNVIHDLLPHDASIILYLLENETPQHITATASSHHPAAPDTAHISLRFRKATAYLNLSWIDPCKARKLTVTGTKKMAVFDDTAQEKLVLYDKSIHIKQPFEVDYHDAGKQVIQLEEQEPLYLELHHFVECIQNHRQPLTDGKNGYQVVKLMNQVEEALT